MSHRTIEYIKAAYKNAILMEDKEEAAELKKELAALKKKNK